MSARPRSDPVLEGLRRSIRRAGTSLFAISLMAQSTNPVDLLKQSVLSDSEKIAYGGTPLQFGELRVPAGKGPFPVAVLVHGGCWSAKLRDLPEPVTSSELLRPIASALCEAGIATWNIEYRRLGHEGGGWPGTFLDISEGTDLLPKLSAKYRLDLNRVVAIGHSSGGQLAMWLAGRHNLPKGSGLWSPAVVRLKGVINIDGPADLRSIQAVEQPMCGGPVVSQLLGGTPMEVPNRYREGSVSGLLPTGVPQVLFMRAAPSEHWRGLTEQYAEEAARAGDSAKVVILKGRSHFDGINPLMPDWQTVLKTVHSMVRK